MPELSASAHDLGNRYKLHNITVCVTSYNYAVYGSFVFAVIWHALCNTLYNHGKLQDAAKLLPMDYDKVCLRQYISNIATI
jgi:hypothetical protein